jgi:hypothetical protein
MHIFLKRVFLIGATGLSLLVGGVNSDLFASPIGNPASPGLMQGGIFSFNPWVKVTTGYLTDYVSNMPLKPFDEKTVFGANDSFGHFGLHSQMASCSIVLLQRLEVYALLGGSKEHLKRRPEQKPSLFSALFDFQSSYHFSWASGLHVILLQWGQTFFSVNASYFAVPSSQKSFFRFLNRLHLPLDSEKQRFNLREWQFDAALSSRFWIFTPYAGASYLRTRLHIQSGQESNPFTYKNSRTIGYFYGLTLSLTGKFHLIGERRVRDEYAYTFSTLAVF